MAEKRLAAYPSSSSVKEERSSARAIPSPTMQGVFGMTKSTRLSSGRMDRSFSVVQPAAMDSTALPASASPISATTASMTLGLTASSTISAHSAASAGPVSGGDAGLLGDGAQPGRC